MLPINPLRTINRFADQALVQLSTDFDQLCAETGWPSISPGRLLKAGLLMALYTVRRKRNFCEQLDYHLLFRWFLDMTLIEPSFTKNRARLIDRQMAQQSFGEVVACARGQRLLSDEHFSVGAPISESEAEMVTCEVKVGGR